MQRNGRKRRWRQLAAAAALILSLIMCALAGRMNGDKASCTVLDGGSTQARLEYIASLGWKVAEEEGGESVLLPERFDGAYKDYQAIQQECGFDLVPYAGQTVIRYSYPITNYPEQAEGVRLDLLVWERQIIGGDVRSAELAGFMHSLRYPRA